MATKTTNAKQDAAGRRVKKAGEPPLANYADKKITPVMEDFVSYIEEQTGYKVDPLSVQLSGVLRGRFQKSDFNQSRIAERKQAIVDEAEARAQRAEERAAAKEEREAARAARVEAKANAPKVEKKAAAKPVAKAAAAKPAAKAAPAKPVAKAGAKVTPLASRRRPAAKGVDTDF